MKTATQNILDALQTFGFFRRKSRKEPVDSVPALCRFVQTRSAFIAQKSMYGYIQTRMGMQYPIMFQDPDFVKSMNIAKMHIYAACLSDLTIYTAAEVGSGDEASGAELSDLALHCYRTAIEANAEHAPTEHWAEDAVREFSQRLIGTDWRGGAIKPENFVKSPLALVKWSPIAPELKQFDAPVVENSIKFAWVEIREEFRRLLDRAAMAAARSP